jgi:hypothetical protein
VHPSDSINVCKHGLDCERTILSLLFTSMIDAHQGHTRLCVCQTALSCDTPAWYVTRKTVAYLASRAHMYTDSLTVYTNTPIHPGMSLECSLQDSSHPFALFATSHPSTLLSSHPRAGCSTSATTLLVSQASRCQRASLEAKR